MTLLRRLRLAKGLTQTALANEIGCDQSAVSMWESGDQMPAPAKIPLLANILGVEPFDLTKVIAPEPQRINLSSAVGQDGRGGGAS